MSISMQSASAPVFVRLLGNLLLWLDKAEAHAVDKKFDAVVYLGTRLAPDMLSFTRQIQIACDGAKFCMARLAGVDGPTFDDSEATLEALRERVLKTIAFIESVPASQVDGSEQKDIVIPRRDGSITMKGEAYLKHFAMPNFYFHLTMAYALLRHNGVALGKMDYLGAMPK